MQHRRLGESGLYVSEIGIGCNNFGVRVDQAGTDAVVAAALDQGIDFSIRRTSTASNAPRSSSAKRSAAVDRTS